MKFRRYHPAFIELDDEEEKEYQKWHDVNGVADCLKVVFPAGPYIACHDGMPEEKVVCVAEGHKYFIDPDATSFVCGDSMYVLMDYAPDGRWFAIGFVDKCDGKTVEWDKDREEWRITDGLPDKRY